ncbi:MAG: hypothetical protein FJ098_00980 [Deltaproteobacteria bacterium]|nr:hypothetical protein [Deltaproteobacteria bacterium]
MRSGPVVLAFMWALVLVVGACDGGGGDGGGGDPGDTTGGDSAVQGCEAGDPCCTEDGLLRPVGEVCLLSEEIACTGAGCGGSPVQRQVFGQCSGTGPECAGVPEPGPWTSLAVCGWNQVCDPGTFTCAAGACELETCGDPDVDTFDKAAANGSPSDASLVLEENAPVDPCAAAIAWEGTLHDETDGDWYRFNVDASQDHGCATWDPRFAFTGIPGARLQFRCWSEGEVAEFDASEGVFDCALTDPVTIDGVALDEALTCRVSASASFTNLRCTRFDYGDVYATTMMVLVGVGTDEDHPCANYSVTVDIPGL